MLLSIFVSVSSEKSLPNRVYRVEWMYAKSLNSMANYVPCSNCSLGDVFECLLVCMCVCVFTGCTEMSVPGTRHYVCSAWNSNAAFTHIDDENISQRFLFDFDLNCIVTVCECVWCARTARAMMFREFSLAIDWVHTQTRSRQHTSTVKVWRGIGCFTHRHLLVEDIVILTLFTLGFLLINSYRNLRNISTHFISGTRFWICKVVISWKCREEIYSIKCERC